MFSFFLFPPILSAPKMRGKSVGNLNSWTTLYGPLALLFLCQVIVMTPSDGSCVKDHFCRFTIGWRTMIIVSDSGQIVSHKHKL